MLKIILPIFNRQIFKLINISKFNNFATINNDFQLKTPFKYEVSDIETEKLLLSNLSLYEHFITTEEEESLFKEIEPYMKRLRYEIDHWDDAIHNYRETERSQWRVENRAVIERMKGVAFRGTEEPIFAHAHILDLAEGGHIKAHIDSVKFCGGTVAGLSLLSDSVMKFVHEAHKERWAKIMLPRRSLYVMRSIVDAIENQTLKFQKMNVELNYVHDSFVEGMMPQNLTAEDELRIKIYPTCRKYQKKLSMFCENVESLLGNCDLLKRKSCLVVPRESVTLQKPLELASLLPCREKFPSINISVVFQTADSLGLVVKVADTCQCLLRFQGTAITSVVIKGPSESFGELSFPSLLSSGVSGPSGAGTEDPRHKWDFFSQSSSALFQRLTEEAHALLCHLGGRMPQERSLAFFEWLSSLSQLHCLPCSVCGKLLGRGHLPAFRRDFQDFSRALHDHCSS